MHTKFGVNQVVDQFDADKLKKFLEFRIDCLQEELDELKEAKNADDAVDALIDLCVFAIGTLDAFRIDSEFAWDAVHSANMVKSPGIKEGRPNPWGLPDLIKPEGWQAPTHVGNEGLLSKVFD
jgi:predicted HAD superfamily Cof-like phosphohydrolase